MATETSASASNRDSRGVPVVTPTGLDGFRPSLTTVVHILSSILHLSPVLKVGHAGPAGVGEHAEGAHLMGLFCLKPLPALPRHLPLHTVTGVLTWCLYILSEDVLGVSVNEPPARLGAGRSATKPLQYLYISLSTGLLSLGLLFLCASSPTAASVL